jgi:CBS domain-containing protein
MEREDQEPTSFSTGFAIPHIHLDNFDDTIIGIAVPEVPISSVNGPIRIVFMVISGVVQSNLYLHVLQSIVKISRNKDYFDHLLSCGKAHDFIKLIEGGDYSVKKNLSVGDLMKQNISCVREDMSLKELGNLFYQNSSGYCPVIDDKGDLIGEVTILELIMAGFPDYTNYLESMNFTYSLEPFEKLLQEENTLYVRDIMKPIEFQLDPEDAIVEAVFLMKKHRKRDIAVIKDRKILGIISFMDIFRRILRG